MYRVLKGNVLAKVSNWYLNFCDTLTNVCPSHALFRGEFYSDDDGFIFVDLLGSDENGKFSRECLKYDPVNHTLETSSDLVIADKELVMNSVHKLIEKLLSMDLGISKVYFDMGRSFGKGLLDTDEEDPDATVLYLIGGVYESNYGIHEACDKVGADIATNWTTMLKDKYME